MSAVQLTKESQLAASVRNGRRKAVDLQARFPILQVVALAAIFAYGSLTIAGLAGWPSIRLILMLAVLVALAAQGQTLLIIMGGFDMSVPGFIVAGTMIEIMPAKFHIPFVAALLIILAVACVLGGMAGQICHRLGLNPLIVTLATGAIALGFSQVITGGHVDAFASAPESLTLLTTPTARTFGLPIPPIISIAIVVIVAMGIFLYRTVGGRRLMATGANKGAAEYVLVKTRKLWTISFAYSAVASALVGVVLVGYTGGIDLSVGDPYLFGGVTAVFIGGTVFGGPGDYTRTVLGALLLQVLATVLIGHGYGASVQEVLDGVFLLAAVALYGRGSRLRDRV